ncbi:TRAP transporter substrate-binding protein [Fodinicurvata sp. EGI_FJ10296]|uniref:TRAP transporter substrate-binding protein n=1 Tax=Fodinicurvata sp. EGI_FJ10296 TaxID=3231908 RepID=UPI00345692B2
MRGKAWGAALLAAGTIAAGTSGAGADEITLRFGHFWPAGAGPHADFALDWTEQVAACADGAVNFDFHTGGSQLGNVTRLEEYLRAGLLDIAHGLNHLPRGRFDAATVIDTPLLARSAYANSNALWSLFEEGLISEPYEGLKVLALHAHDAGLIHTAGTPVRTPADAAGLRIRTPAPSVALMIESLDAVPVGVPPTETYETLARGIADGTVFPYEAVFGFNLAEVLDYHSEIGLYTTSFWFAMNEDAYNGLPDTVRDCVDEASYRPLASRFGEEYWPSWDEPGKELAIAEGNEIIELTEEEQALWQAHFEPVAEEWLDSLQAEGVDNAHEIYARAQELVAEYQAEYESR